MQSRFVVGGGDYEQSRPVWMLQGRLDSFAASRSGDMSPEEEYPEGEVAPWWRAIQTGDTWRRVGRAVTAPVIVGRRTAWEKGWEKSSAKDCGLRARSHRGRRRGHAWTVHHRRQFREWWSPEARQAAAR